MLARCHKVASMALESQSCVKPALNTKTAHFNQSSVIIFSVLQLVKSQKMHVKLVIIMETEKEKVLRKEFVFNDAKVNI